MNWVRQEFLAVISRNALASGSNRYEPGLAPSG